MIDLSRVRVWAQSMAFSDKDKLAGSSDSETGGLFIQKRRKKLEDDDDEKFKKPKVSLLGLDMLAKEKRKSNDDSLKVSKSVSKSKDFVSELKLDDSGNPRISFGMNKPRDRHYRYFKTLFDCWTTTQSSTTNDHYR